MKNFFDCEHCVFVIAVDRDVVYQGIQVKYGDKISEQKKQQFFDKIIQLPFNLPTSQYDVVDYFKALLKNNVDGQIAEEDAEAYSDLFTSILGTNNPRSIKRILNLWDLYQLIYPIEDSTQKGKASTSGDTATVEGNGPNKKLMLFGALTLKTWEELNLYTTGDDKDSSTTEDDKTKTPVTSEDKSQEIEGRLSSRPYSTLTEAARTSADEFDTVLKIAAAHKESPVYILANTIGLYEGNNTVRQDDSKGEAVFETFRSLLSSISEMFTTGNDAEPATTPGLSTNATFNKPCALLREGDRAEKKLADDRIDFWAGKEQQGDIKGNVSIRDMAKPDKPGDDVHIIFYHLNTGKDALPPNFKWLLAKVKDYLNEWHGRLRGTDNQEWATLTGINSSNVNDARNLIEAFLVSSQRFASSDYQAS